MKFKAILFDLDGTIIDTREAWENATKRLITSRSIAVTQDLSDKLYELNKGTTIYIACENIKNLAGLKETVEDLVMEKKAYAREEHEKNLQFIDGFLDFNQEITNLNFKKALATNTHDEVLEILKKSLKLEQYFKEHIYNITNVNFIAKPRPDLFLYAANQLKCNPDECIVIEDSSTGIEAAKAANMFCIGINTGNDKNNLKKADFIIDSYKEINIKKLLKN